MATEKKIKGQFKGKVLQVSFNAVPWFQQATNSEIITLADCGWGGEPGHEISLFMEGEEDHAAVFMFKNCNGFDCHIDKKDALAWLKENRFDVYRTLLLTCV